MWAGGGHGATASVFMSDRAHLPGESGPPRSASGPFCPLEPQSKGRPRHRLAGPAAAAGQPPASAPGVAAAPVRGCSGHVCLAPCAAGFALAQSWNVFFLY